MQQIRHGQRQGVSPEKLFWSTGENRYPVRGPVIFLLKISLDRLDILRLVDFF
jgi:hypothetical protein